MSSVRFFPISWFPDSNWKSIQVIGRLENNKSIYIRIGFRPYFTVRYPDTISTEVIDESHNYLISETPIAETKKLSNFLYRIYVMNKDDYSDSILFYEKNGLGEILDRQQEIRSKFFGDKNLDPGLWQQASDLKTLLYNVTTSSNYTSADLEFYTVNIVSLQEEQPPIPVGLLAFFDIEAIPSDDIHFPDAENERPVDNIFAISLLIVSSNDVRYIIYLLTDKELSSLYMTNKLRTRQSYQVEIVRSLSERDLIQNFFDGLALYRPDRLIQFNGRRFDINYLGARSKSLGVEISSFTKILNYTPYFYQTQLIQTKPFPLVEQVWALSTPGISQIDLLDFYRRLYPQLGNHKLETISRLLLGRGKTGLEVKEMFAKYRRGTVEDLLEIVDYSINDSVLLYDLWIKSEIPKWLAVMASEWKNDSERVLSQDLELLFEDLIRYLQPSPPLKQYETGRPFQTERKSGIHRNIYLYSLSNIYLTFLEQLNDPVANRLVEYFKNTNDGIIPFKSGYFPVTFNQVMNFINQQIESDKIIWIEENSLAVQKEFPFFPLTDFIPLIIVSQKSWILVNKSKIIFKKGTSNFVRPPFRLVERYVDYIVKYLMESINAPTTFPELETSLDDFILENKVTADDFIRPPPRKVAIIQQLRELGLPVSSSWRRVRYIKTRNGPIIEEVFSKDPKAYSGQLDLDYYNKTLQNTIKSIF